MRALPVGNDICGHDGSLYPRRCCGFCIGCIADITERPNIVEAFVAQRVLVYVYPASVVDKWAAANKIGCGLRWADVNHIEFAAHNVGAPVSVGGFEIGSFFVAVDTY